MVEDAFGAAAVAGLITMSHVIFPGIPEWTLLCAIALVGSCVSAVVRLVSKDLKGKFQALMAVFMGWSFAFLAYFTIEKLTGLEGLETGVFVFLLSFIGSKFCLKFILRVDVDGHVDQGLKKVLSSDRRPVSEYEYIGDPSYEENHRSPHSE